MAICHSSDNVNVNEYDHSQNFSLVEFEKNTFCAKKFSLLLLYKNNRTKRDVVIYFLAQYIERHSIDIILGDFNINGFETNDDLLLRDLLQPYELLVDFPTHIDGGMLDQVWMRKDLLNRFDMRIVRKCLNISDHDAVKVSLTLKQDLTGHDRPVDDWKSPTS